ncbi:condensation domain-containing protein [Streptomyces aurantiacus]|uniref:condensation domain-containing protein n=1 Tax=Streptomyces aurantiacus TaxID=47760 RepID=UPI00040A017F
MTHSPSTHTTHSLLPLSRAQLYFWHLYAEQPRTAGRWNLLVRSRVPDRTSLADVRTALQLLVDRHEALRSTIEPGPLPRQRINTSGSMVMRVRELDSDADEQVTDALREAGGQTLDAEHGPTVRADVLTVASVPRWVALVVHHMFATARTMDVLQDELQHMLAHLRAGADPQEGLDPAQSLARRIEYEQSPQGLLRADRAIRHLTGVIEQLPNVLLPFREHHAPEPVVRQKLRMHSAAVTHAADIAARRLKVPRYSVVFAAVDVVLSTYAGQNVAWTMYMDKGAVDKGRSLIDCTTQNVYAQVGSRAHQLFSQAVRAAWKQQFVGQVHCDYDYARLLEAHSDVGLDQRTWKSVNLWFNCRGAFRSSDEPDAHRLDGLRRRSRLKWEEVSDDRPLVAVEVRFLRPEACLDLWVGRELILPDDMVDVLKAIEELLVRFAVDGEVPLEEARKHMGAGAWPRLPELRRLRDGRWIDFEATRAVFLCLPGVLTAELEVVDTGPHQELVVTVETTAGDITEAGLRNHGQQRIRTHGVVLPDTYVVRRAGTGQKAASTDDRATRLLCETVAEATGRPHGDAHASYRAQGGSAEQLPWIKMQLESRGIRPFDHESLLAPASLGEVAQALRR